MPETSVTAKAPGNAAKKSLASLAMTAASGIDTLGAYTLSAAALPAASCEGAAAAASRDPGSLVLMVAFDIHVFQHAHSVFREDRGRAIQGDQVRGNRFAVDAHKAHGKTG